MVNVISSLELQESIFHKKATQDLLALPYNTIIQLSTTGGIIYVYTWKGVKLKSLSYS